jgi:pSer/pThr/pTyr-binding forkhead associated (FHA) protein
VARRLFLVGSVAGRPSTWQLDRPRIGVGRSASNIVQLQDETVSREQAEILAEGEVWLLRDLNGKNVTRVNGAPAKDLVPLRLGDRITFGRVVLCVTDGRAPPATRLSDSETLATSLQVPAREVLSHGLAGGVGPPAVVRALATPGGLLVKEGPLQETCNELLRIVEEVLPASRMILLVRSQPDSEPVQFAARSRGEITPEPLLLSRGILGAVLESGSSVITTDAMADPRFEGFGSVVAN